MKRRRRVLQTVLECVVAFVLVVMSMVGTGAISVASAHVAARQPSSPAPTTSGGSFSPGLPSASAPVGAWYAPHSAMSGPLYGPYTASTTTTLQKRQPGEQSDLRTAASETKS